MQPSLRRRRVLNVVICDDHPIFREGLKTALSMVDDIAVAGEAGSGPELLEVLARTPCNVILLDIGLPGPDGLDVLKDLAYRDNRVPVLVLSMYPEEHYALRAFRGGAAGDHQGCCSIGNAGRVPSCHRASLAKCRPESCQCRRTGIAPGTLVHVEQNRRALALRDWNRDNLPPKSTFVYRSSCTLVAE